MSQKQITLSDLKERGLRLTKDDATELLPFITEISHRGLDDNYIYIGPLKNDVEDFEDEELIDDEPEDDHLDEVDDHPSDEVPEDTADAVDEQQESKYDEDPETLSAEQEGNLMKAIGITVENTPEEYLAALNSFIEGTDEVPPKLLNKKAFLEETIAASSESQSQTNDGSEQTEGKKEHYLTKRKRLKDAGLMEYTITQEDIDNSKYSGKAGDVIEIPIPPAE